MAQISFSKVCEIEDFSDPELNGIISEVFPHEQHEFTADLSKGVQYPKYWEAAMSIRALRHLNLLHSNAVVLCIGAGTETMPFYLTQHTKQVFAIDKYLSPAAWHDQAPAFMLVQPGEAAPYAYEPQRLVVQHMDPRCLSYPDDFFDSIVTASSIETLDSLEFVANAAYEMGRVLKPGGVLTLATKYCISGPPGASGWDGCTLFSRNQLMRYVVEASGLELVGELSTELSEQTLTARRSLTKYAVNAEDYLAHQARYAPANASDWSKHPLLIHIHQGYVFCSIHITLHKSATYPVGFNGWAKPSADVLEVASSVPGLFFQPSTLSTPSSLVQKSDTPMTVSLDEKLITLRNLYRAWDGARIRGWYNATLRRLPLGLGRAGRTFVRVMQLGRVFDAQSLLYNAMLEYQQDLSTQMHSMAGKVAALSERIDAQNENGRLIQQQSERLSELNTRIVYFDALLRQIAEQLDQQQALFDQQLGTQQTHLNTVAVQHEALSQQLKLHTGYIRLFQQQLELNGPEHTSRAGRSGLVTAELIELLRMLEQQISALAQARAIELSIQDGMAEGTLMEGVAFFGQRMSSAGANYRAPNDAWYHVDHTPDWNRLSLFESAVARLEPGGHFILVTSAEHSDPAGNPLLEPLIDHLKTLSSGTQARVYVWRRSQ